MHTILYPVNELKIGGAEQQLLELVRTLDKSRFKPIVAPLYPGGALRNEFEGIPGVTLIDLNRRGKFDPSPIWRIASIISEHRVDVVQPFLSPATFFSLPPSLMNPNVVVVVTERCGIRNDRGRGYKVYRLAEDALSRFADAIVPNSLAGAEMLRERGLRGPRVRVVYNGINVNRLQADPLQVDQIRQQLAVPPGGTVIGILASLTPSKGHETLLRAVALLRDRRPEIRLAIVGDGSRRSRLEDLVRELGLDEQVVFFGYRRNVADYLSVFDLLVSASVDNEGCSNSILEAMTLGVPVLATDIGGNRELVEDGLTGRLTPAGDEDALARAVEDLISDPTGTIEIAQRAREMVLDRFSLDRMVQEYERLYLQLLDDSRYLVEDADGVVVSIHR